MAAGITPNGLMPPKGRAMAITIRVYQVGCPGVDRIVARGFLPSGQNFIEGKMREGSDEETQEAAIAEIVNWLRKNRPDFDIVLAGPDGSKVIA